MSASPGTAGRRISSTCASRRRSAAARLGCTADDVSAGVRSAGIDWTTAIRASAAGFNGNSRSSLRTSVIGPPRQLRGECLMFTAPDDIDRGLVEASQPVAELIQPVFRRGVLVGIEEAPPLCLG